MIDIIDEFGNKVVQLEKEILDQISLNCKCSFPGETLECFDCKDYLQVINKIQCSLYKYPHKECIVPFEHKDGTTRYSEEEKQKVITLYQELKSIPKVQMLTGICGSTISKWVRQYGIHVEGKFFHPPIYDEEFRKKAILVYIQCNNVAKAAFEVGVSDSALRKWIMQAIERGEDIPHPSKRRGKEPKNKNVA